MKKHIILKWAFLLAAWLLVAPPLTAQTGLNVNRLFDGRYRGQKNAIEVLVKGKKLQPYKLTLFRSLTLKDAGAQIGEMEQLVRLDGAKAVDKETGLIGQHLYYGFYRFAATKGKYRYLFFRNNTLRNPQSPEATVVYMEGYATLAEMKSMFK
jgi:hypothetical protein